MNDFLLEGYSEKEYQEGHARKIYLEERDRGKSHSQAMEKVKEVYEKESVNILSDEASGFVKKGHKAEMLNEGVNSYNGGSWR